MDEKLDQIHLQMDSCPASVGLAYNEHDEENTNEAVPARRPSPESSQCDARLCSITSELSGPETSNMTKVPTGRSSYGSQESSRNASNGGVVCRGSDGYNDPYTPPVSDVPSSLLAYCSPGTDREDEPLLDLSSSATGVDHCHAAVGNAPDTSANRRAQKQLLFAACVCFLFMVGEIVGGWISQSLAIMTDAAHLLSDFTSFLISLFALWLARRPPTAKMSFGYFRAEILGAVISVLIIWVATGVLIYLAVQRCITNDYDINGKVMLITAGCGLGVNILLALVLYLTGHSHSHGGLGHGHSHSHGGGRPDSQEESRYDGNNGCGTGYKAADDELQPISIQSDPLLAVDVRVADADVAPAVHGRSRPTNSRSRPMNSESNMNVRAAFIHILGDLLQSVGVCIAAIIILVQPEWKIADPICTFTFSVFVLITTILILRDAIQVLMEGVPKHINLHHLRSDLKSLPHVRMAHGLHVWSLTTSQAAIAVHLCIDAGEDAEHVLQQASQLVRSKYNIIFSTIQVEHYQPEVMNNCGRCRESNC